tara:strand:- start:796 stop:972 length:177 start_codon:yes stop_codon:yes gene_type:complete
VEGKKGTGAGVKNIVFMGRGDVGGRGQHYVSIFVILLKYDISLLIIPSNTLVSHLAIS